jgi:hypothetical protein
MKADDVGRLTKTASRYGLTLIATRKGWALHDPYQDALTGPPWLPRERAEAMTLDEVDRALTQLGEFGTERYVVVRR